MNQIEKVAEAIATSQLNRDSDPSLSEIDYENFELRQGWTTDAIAAIAAMPGWQDISNAPQLKFVPVWGHGRMRFMRKDKNGQWRNGYGAPRQPPKLWFDLPDVPEQEKG